MSEVQEALKYLAWFSCGDASAVATKLALDTWGDQVTVVYTDTGSEHPDNVRFREDCQAWFGVPVQVMKSEKYDSVDEVIEGERYINGPTGAKCTVELKKKVRWRIERDYDFQVYGYTADPKDAARADRFREQNPDVKMITPLIERGLTKQDCHAIVASVGIEIPEMYKLGYENNNCIGCVKGGMGYFNKIRVDFPEVFERRARQERMLGHTIIRDNKGPVYLDELDPDRGNYASEPSIDCGPLCSTTVADLELGDLL